MKYRLLIVHGRGCAALHVWAARDAAENLIAAPKKSDALPFAEFEAADQWRQQLIGQLPIGAAVEVVIDRE